MDNFSFGTFLLGISITLLSGVFVGYHRKIANIIGNGVSDYDKYKKWGLIALTIGILIAFNLHRFVLMFFVNAIIK